MQGRTWGAAWITFLLSSLVRWYAAFWHRCRRTLPPFPATGPALVVVNHTCSADPMFLLSDSPRVLSFVTTREHYNLSPPTRWVLRFIGCVPIERGGKDVVGVRKALRCLQEGRILCLFPEGNLSGVELGRMRRWKHGAAFLALKTGVPIYPAWIEGGPRTDLLLPAWLLRSGKAVRVYYGPAVELSAYLGKQINRAILEEVTELLRQKVAALQPRKRYTRSG